MDAFWNFLKTPFAWGLLIGLFLYCFSAYSHWKTKRELKSFKTMLNNKLQLESEQLEALRKAKEALAKENENLRVRVQQLADRPEQKLMRDLEIYARAEKRMIIQAPGFGGAWEAAKLQVGEELAAEDAGKSLPKRFFQRIFGSGSAQSQETLALPPASAAGGDASSGKQAGM